MTNEILRRARERFDGSDAFERHDEDEYEGTTTAFDSTVRLSEADGAVAVRVTVRVPTLDAVVAGEEVAPVVEDGWFETLERRLADAHTVTLADEASPATVEREGDTVRVELDFRTADPETAPADAQAVAEFVEGTWLQGVIPGYEYVGAAKELLDRAEQNYDA